jgi:hypothetical protein
MTEKFKRLRDLYILYEAAQKEGKGNEETYKQLIYIELEQVKLDGERIGSSQTFQQWRKINK